MSGSGRREMSRSRNASNATRFLKSAVNRRLFLAIPVSPLDTGVHLSDLSKKVGPPQYAVVAISEAAREDLAPFDIGVSALCPGMIDTRILRSDRNRPAALSERSTGMFGDTERQEVEERFATEALNPDVVGEQVLDGIRRNKPFIFTHASLKDGIRERMDRILACFDGGEV